jgi:hypothetical protein
VIAKGHFPRVTLVGVISADVGLGAPISGVRATFQLLTQVAGGRAARNPARRLFRRSIRPRHSAHAGRMPAFTSAGWVRRRCVPPAVSVINVSRAAFAVLATQLSDVRSGPCRVRTGAGALALGSRPLSERRRRRSGAAVIKGPSAPDADAIRVACLRYPEQDCRRTITDPASKGEFCILPLAICHASCLLNPITHSPFMTQRSIGPA